MASQLQVRGGREQERNRREEDGRRLVEGSDRTLCDVVETFDALPVFVLPVFVADGSRS